MSVLTSDRLLEKAKNGEKLSVEERRRVVRYLMLVNPENTNDDLAELFGISEGMIRKDKKTIRQEISDDLRADDVGLTIADIEFNFRRQLGDLEKSKSKCSLGSTEYRLHCQAILDIELKKVKAFQDLGYLPKNLGNLITEHYEYAAVVIKDGSVESRPVNLFDEATQSALRQRETPKALPQQIEGEVVKSTEVMNAA